MSTLISSNDVASRVVAVAGDISKPETSQQFVDTIVASFPERRLDVFVSNAGVCQFAEFLDLSPALLEHTVGTNLNGAFYAVQAAGRQMALNQTPSGGSIIGISSISALVGGGQQTHYTPTKAGVKSLMQSCAVALGKYGIRCNSLLPGTIRTQLNDADLADDAKRIYTEGRTPLGRLGQTRDLAGPAVFLACDELSSFVVSIEVFLLFLFFLSTVIVGDGVAVTDTMLTNHRQVQSFWSTAACLSTCSSTSLCYLFVYMNENCILYTKNESVIDSTISSQRRAAREPRSDRLHMHVTPQYGVTHLCTQAMTSYDFGIGNLRSQPS